MQKKDSEIVILSGRVTYAAQQKYDKMYESVVITARELGIDPGSKGDFLNDILLNCDLVNISPDEYLKKKAYASVQKFS